MCIRMYGTTVQKKIATCIYSGIQHAKLKKLYGFKQ